MNAVVGQIRRYVAFAAWFFRDAFLRYRGRLILIAAANLVGVGFQALALLIAYRYASAVEAGKTIGIAGYVVDPRGSFALLAATALSAFLVAVASAVFIMRARVEGAKVALDYGEYCSQRVYSLLSRLTLASQGEAAEDYTVERFFELTRRDARYCTQVLRIMSYGLLHLGTFLVAGAALLYLDVYLSLVVFAILAVAALFLRRTSIRGASQRDRLQRHAPEMIKERRVLEDRLLRNPAPILLSDATLRQTVSHGGAAKIRGAQLGQRQALEGAKLIAQIAIGGALFLVLMVQGAATLSQASNWSALLAYIAALSFFGGSMAKVGRMLVNMNRFYPPLARHARFVQRAERDLGLQGQQAEGGHYLMEAPFLGGESASPLELRPGDRIALAVPGDLTRLSILPLGKALRPGGARTGRQVFPWFAPCSVVLGAGTLRENLGLPVTCSMDDLRREIDSLKLEENWIRLPPELDRPLTEAEREALSPPALFILTVLSGVLNRCGILVLEEAGLASLASQVQHRLLEKLSSTVALVSYRASRISTPLNYGESALIIVGAEEVLGWTRPAILNNGCEAVSQALARSASESRASRSAVLDEDDLEEME